MTRFTARVVEGKLRLSNPDGFKIHLQQFKPDDLLIVTVEKPKKERTNQQNKFYWSGVLGTITLDTGHTQSELHEVFKRMFLPKRFITIKDKEVELMGTTTALSTKEMGEYIDRITAYCASELGIAIPSPDEYLEN